MYFKHLPFSLSTTSTITMKYELKDTNKDNKQPQSITVVSTNPQTEPKQVKLEYNYGPPPTPLCTSHVQPFNQPPVYPYQPPTANFSNLTNQQFHQIRRSIQIMKSVFSQYFNDQFINQLYLSLFRKFTHQPDQHNRQPKTKKNWQEMRQSLYQSVASQLPPRPINNNHGQRQEYLQNGSISQVKATRGRRRRRHNDEGKGKKILRDIWSGEMQSDFLDLVKQKKSYGDIRITLQQKYPQFAEYFEYYQIRNEAYKIYRLAIRKIQSYVKNQGLGRLPQLIKVNEPKSSYIHYYKGGQEIRFLLIDVYRMQSFNLNFIGAVIERINGFFNNLDENQLIKMHQRNKKIRNKNHSKSEISDFDLYSLAQSRVEDDFEIYGGEDDNQ